MKRTAKLALLLSAALLLESALSLVYAAPLNETEAVDDSGEADGGADNNTDNRDTGSNDAGGNTGNRSDGNSADGGTVIQSAAAQTPAPAVYRQIRIATAEDLIRLSEACTLDTASRDMEVTLTADIDLSGADFTSIPAFGGIFNGNGHTVSGFSLHKTGAAQGFFRYIMESGLVKDLSLEGTVYSDGSRENIGGFAGVNYGKLTGCSFNGTVTGQTQTGGIAGLNEASGVISACRTQGAVTGEHFTGGLAGKNLGVLASCTNSASVNTNSPDTKPDLEALNLERLNSTENINSHTDTGGITGYSSGIVLNCSNLGTVGYPHTGYNVGGVSGRQNGYLSGCSNQGAVYGRKDVAGIAGQAEPYLMMDFSEDTMQRLDTEIGRMHDLINTSAGRLSDNTSLVASQLDTLTGHFRTAGDSLHTVMNSLVSFTNDSMDAVNDTSARLGDLTAETDLALGDLSTASGHLEQAAGDMNASFDKLQEEKQVADALTKKVDAILQLLKPDTPAVNNAVSETAAAVSGLSTSRNSLGNYASLLYDSVSGNTLPEQERTRLLSDVRDAQASLSDYDRAAPTLTGQTAGVLSDVSSYEAARSAAIAPLGSSVTADTLNAAADGLTQSTLYAQSGIDRLSVLEGQAEPAVNALNRAYGLLENVSNSLSESAAPAGAAAYADPPTVPSLSELLDALQKLEDALNGSSGITGDIVTILKEMVPYFEQAGKIAADSLEYMKKAFAGMSSGFSSVGDAIDGMHGAVSGLAAKPDVVFPRFDSTGSAAIDTLFSSVLNAADTVSLLNDTMKRLGSAASEDIRAINDQLQVIFGLLIDAQDTTASGLDGLMEDVSDSENYEHTEGKISGCVNNGPVEGDIDVGGIVGMMAQEYDFDPEDDINNIGDRSLNFKYKTRAVAASCTNRGPLVAKKDQLGGIVGRMDLGSVIDCRSYGSLESETGDYVGGIVGYSSSVVKNSFSLCSLKGGDYIGGIAGYGFDIENCRSLVSIESDGEALGAVAGYARGRLSDNYFVENEREGVDGISYDGAAMPQSYETFIKDSALPSEFKNFRLRFVADGRTVANFSVEYGSSLPRDRVPAVPPKEGFYADWPEFDFDRITQSAVLEARYTPWVTVLSSDTARADSGLPVFLAQGEFTPDATLQALSLDGAVLPSERDIAEAWQITVEGLKTPDTQVTLRFLSPDRDTEYTLFYLEDGSCRKITPEKEGSYLIFPAAGAVTRIALSVKSRGNVLLPVAVLPAALLLILLFLALRRSKRKGPLLRKGHSKRHTVEESPHSPDNG